MFAAWNPGSRHCAQTRACHVLALELEWLRRPSVCGAVDRVRWLGRSRFRMRRFLQRMRHEIAPCSLRRGHDCVYMCVEYLTRWNGDTEMCISSDGAASLFSLGLAFHPPQFIQTFAMFSPYSGTSTLAKVLRAACLGGGVVYGSLKLGYLKVREFRAGRSCTRWVVRSPDCLSRSTRDRHRGRRPTINYRLSTTDHRLPTERGVVERKEGRQGGGEALGQ